MFRVWQVEGTQVVKIRVEAAGVGCDCAVLVNQGSALIFSPPDKNIRLELLENGREILRGIHGFLPEVRNLKMCDQS